jgi:hypothetical protein
MRWWLLEIPVREKSLRSKSIFRILGIAKVETLRPTDPPR